MAGLGERDGWDLVGIADTPGNAMDVWVALALAAERTTRVPLAACVTNLVTRHPGVTASAAASVDALSSGRLVLGVGTGHSGVVNVGAAASTPADFRRELPRLRELAAAASVGRPGRRVPVYAAASGPAALKAAGAVADGVFVNYGLGAGHSANVFFFPSDSSRTLENTWATQTSSISMSFGLPSAFPRRPLRDACRNRLCFHRMAVSGICTTRRADMDPALTRRLGVFDYLRGRLAIAGTPDDCLAQVRAALTAGAHSLMFTVSLASDPVRTVELFGRHVLGRLKGVQPASPA